MNNNNNRLSSNKISYPRGFHLCSSALGPFQWTGSVPAGFDPLVAGFENAKFDFTAFWNEIVYRTLMCDFT
jgi:hypothetical protein